MQEQISYFSAFLVGFLGVVHCAGMCGGVIAALSMNQGMGQVIETGQGKSLKKLFILLAYNLARLSSYTIAGGLIASVGWFATNWMQVHYAQGILQLLAGLFMLALGLYLGGWWFLLSKVERAGAKFWHIIEPLSKRFMPVKTVPQAFVVGLVWGWLPCGLVYSVLIWSMTAGSFEKGALLMLSFGLGTLPNLLLMGFFAGSLTRYFQNSVFRKISGGMIVAFSFYLMFLAVKVIRQV